MRILHLVQRYAPARGGAEAHMQGLSERMARDGHAVTVATTDVAAVDGFWTANYAKVDRACDEINGVRVRRFPIRQPPFPPVMCRVIRRAEAECSVRGIGGTRWLRWLAQQALAAPELHRWLGAERDGFDIVAGMGISFDSLYAPALDYARTRHTPFAFYPLTHLAEPEAPRRLPFAAPTLRDYYSMRQQLALLQASDAVMTQNELETKFLVSKGIAPSRIVEAGPGTEPAAVTGGDVDRFRGLIGTRDPIVLSLGVQSRDKGTIHLLEAMSRLWQGGMEVCLVLAGAVMPEVASVLRRQPRSVLRNVHNLGIVGDDTKRDALAACALLALPSRTDSFGIVLLEAWLNRKAVIGANAGGLPAVIAEGRDGLLVPFGNVSALANALETLLRDPGKRAALGEAGYHKTMTRYTWDVIYPRVRDTYERIHRSAANERKT